MNKDQKWLTEYIIQRQLTIEELKQMSPEELKKTWKDVSTDFNFYSRKRYGKLKKIPWEGDVVIKPSKEEFDKEHDDWKYHVTKNLKRTREMMQEKGFSTFE